MKLLILPHQLFDKKYLPDKKEIEEIIIYEHPQYFTKYNFNKKKLVLHRASMKYYENYLKTKKYTVSYVTYNDKSPMKECTHCFDPIDKINIEKLEVLESPNFLLTKEDYLEYRKKTKTFFFNSFYMWSKNKVDIIPNIKSQDKYNRESFSNKIKIPKLPNNGNPTEKKFIKEAQEYVDNHFKNNYGTTEGFQFPISHSTAKKWFNNFLKNKLKVFGPYQDFIVKDEDYMFHSCLSTSINIGLLQPLEIIETIKPMKSSYPLNSYEGYIRQLF
jgi:deoxyribodipyrimidine photolyase-related protein